MTYVSTLGNNEPAVGENGRCVSFDSRPSQPVDDGFLVGAADMGIANVGHTTNLRANSKTFSRVSLDGTYNLTHSVHGYQPQADHDP